MLVKEKQRNLLTTEKEKKIRWTEHFQEILNRPPPSKEADIQDAQEDLDIIMYIPTKEEIVVAIKSLKNGKALGPGQSKCRTV